MLLISHSRVKYLRAFPKGEKSLVFSQFTKFLEKIESHLKAAGIKTVRLDGSMSQKRRAEVIDEFQNSPASRADGEDEDADSSATEMSDADGESEDTQYGSDDDDFVPATNSRKRKGRSAASQKPRKKQNGKETRRSLNLKGKGKGRAGTQARLSDGPTVMLISLQAGSQGLNLTAAQVNRHFLLVYAD